MPFKSGHSPNPQGRPPGSPNQVGLTVRDRKRLLKALVERAEAGDAAAQDSLFIFWMQQEQTGAQA